MRSEPHSRGLLRYSRSINLYVARCAVAVVKTIVENSVACKAGSAHGGKLRRALPGAACASDLARSAALQANPDLIVENKKLMDRMRALEDKLDAIMIKSNPTIAPIIARANGR